ncbi:MAG: hypothetical protein ACK40X_01895 [Armatimonadota bacterium]
MRWFLLWIRDFWLNCNDARSRIAERIMFRGLSILRQEHAPHRGLRHLLLKLGLK